MPGDLNDLRENWDALAEEDPLWAVLTDPDLRGRGWGPDEFLASGEREIETVIARIRALVEVRTAMPALDFGCGAGRLTQALARRFVAAHGVDISEAMLRT